MNGIFTALHVHDILLGVFATLGVRVSSFPNHRVSRTKRSHRYGVVLSLIRVLIFTLSLILLTYVSVSR